MQEGVCLLLGVNLTPTGLLSKEPLGEAKGVGASLPGSLDPSDVPFSSTQGHELLLDGMSELSERQLILPSCYFGLLYQHSQLFP